MTRPEDSARNGDVYLPSQLTRPSLVMRRAVLVAIIAADVAAIYGVILFAQWLMAVTK